MDALTTGQECFEAKVRFINQLDDALFTRVNAPLPEGDKYESLDALREKLSHQADGMAELLLRMGVLTEAEFYEWTPKIWSWRDNPARPQQP